jgi:hypothetical protein
MCITLPTITIIRESIVACLLNKSMFVLHETLLDEYQSYQAIYAATNGKSLRAKAEFDHAVTRQRRVKPILGMWGEYNNTEIYSSHVSVQASNYIQMKTTMLPYVANIEMQVKGSFNIIIIMIKYLSIIS